MEIFIAIIKAVPCYALCSKISSNGCYCSIHQGFSVATLDYLRSGDAKNFPWRENPTADLLLLPNLQQKERT